MVDDAFVDVQDDLGKSQRKGPISIVSRAAAPSDSGAAGRSGRAAAVRLAVHPDDGAVWGLVGADDLGKVRGCMET